MSVKMRLAAVSFVAALGLAACGGNNGDNERSYECESIGLVQMSYTGQPKDNNKKEEKNNKKGSFKLFDFDDDDEVAQTTVVDDECDEDDD